MSSYRDVVRELYDDEYNPLNDMMQIISRNIVLVNCGGCGIATYILVYLLRQRGITATVAYYHHVDNQVKMSEYLNLLNNREFNKGYITASHFFVSIPNIHFAFDSIEYVNPENIHGYYSLSRLRRAIAKGGWNNTYFKEQNRRLYNIINSYIDDVVNYLNQIKK
jgi:hypothetical protein